MADATTSHDFSREVYFEAVRLEEAGVDTAGVDPMIVAHDNVRARWGDRYPTMRNDANRRKARANRRKANGRPDRDRYEFTDDGVPLNELGERMPKHPPRRLRPKS